MSRALRVAVDGSCLLNRRGYGRFTRCLMRAVLAAGGRHELILVADAETAARSGLPASTRWEIVRGGGNGSGRSLGGILAVSRALLRVAPDWTFFPSVFTFVPLPPGPRVLLGDHDVIAEEHPELVFPGLLARAAWFAKARLAHARADHVLTVSNHSRGGLLRVFRHDPEDVSVVDEAPDDTFRPLAPEDVDRSVVAGLGLAPGEPYLAYLGGVNPHKNLPAYVEALARYERSRASLGGPPARLVIVGDVEGDRFTPGLGSLLAALARNRMEDRVLFAGFRTDEEVVHLFAGARALVLPSMNEGFGLPAIEAAACGLPVIATRHSPLPELLGEGGLFVDPCDVDGMAAATGRLLRDPVERDRRGAEALRRAGRLTWSRSASQLLALLDRLAEGPA